MEDSIVSEKHLSNQAFGSSHLVKVVSRHGDLQVVDSVKLHLQAKARVQKTVGPADDDLGAGLFDLKRRSHPFLVHL